LITLILLLLPSTNPLLNSDVSEFTTAS
jgi:hypothetical protein